LKFLDELLRWNRSINLTAVRDTRAAVEKHLVDSLTLLPLLEGGETLLDLGSGGGLPCIPLKIALPGLRVVSVEVIGKKAAFQRHAARTLELRDFEVRQARAENLPAEGLDSKFEIVVSRAFSSLGDFVSLALPCLAPGGRIVAMKGPEGESEVATAAPLLDRFGLHRREIRRLRLPSGADRTLIILMRGEDGSPGV
jgi:16S rRNA (guanine527-N7)-methyltransferase